MLTASEILAIENVAESDYLLIFHLTLAFLTMKNITKIIKDLHKKIVNQYVKS